MTLSSDEWKKTIVQEGVAKCQDCGSTDLMTGACAIGAMTVHQEYVYNTCARTSSRRSTRSSASTRTNAYPLPHARVPLCHAATLAALARQPVMFSVSMALSLSASYTLTDGHLDSATANLDPKWHEAIAQADYSFS